MKFITLIIALTCLQISNIAYALDSTLDMSYRRVLPLEQGSNFRDGGDYPTLDGTQVVRGKLFRSAAMYAIESQEDINYLKKFEFRTVLDLRSQEERELQPDRWVLADESIEYVAHDYSIMALMSQAKTIQKAGGTFDMPTMYKGLHKTLTPQLKLYFEALLQNKAPIVMHCSAGQDRTGFVSAMMLSALNVDRNLILEDYQMSTDFRRPMIEKGDIDYKEAAKQGNTFAKIMLQYSDGKLHKYGNPLRTEQGKSFLAYSFETIEAEYGSVNKYLETEVGLKQSDFKKLKKLYTK